MKKKRKATKRIKLNWIKMKTKIKKLMPISRVTPAMMKRPKKKREENG